MKKIIVFVMAILLLCGCTSSETTKTDATTTKQPTVETLDTAQTYTIDDQLEFEIIKTSLTKEIAPTNKNKTYQYLQPIDQQHIFIDMILKTKNLSDKEYELHNIYQGTMHFAQEEHDIELAIESSYFTQLSTTDTLKPQEERYVHLYCEVKNENEKDVQMDLKVMNQKEYQYTFSLEEVHEDSQVKSIGDVINCTSSQIVLLDYQQSERIEPSQKGFFYSYHPTENDNQIFVVLSLEIQNQSSLDIDPSQYLYCEYQIDEDIIHSQIILESEDHESISKKGSILAGQKRTLYLAMPILKTQANKEGTLELFVEGNTYEIDWQSYQNM